MRMHVHVYMCFHYSSETKEEARHPRTESRLLENMTKDPISEFLNQKNPDICSGATGYISSEEIFSFSNANDNDSRPFNFLFQIARGSGTTLSECTFFFEKAHVTKKTSSRQTTSRPQDKKNLDRAISEFFLIRNPGICSGALRRRIRTISRQDPPAPCSE